MIRGPSRTNGRLHGRRFIACTSFLVIDTICTMLFTSWVFSLLLSVTYFISIGLVGGFGIDDL